MPTVRLTQIAAAKLTPPSAGRVVYWDRLLPGFGLRVSASGAKSWVAMYRVDGKSILETLGPLGKIPKVDDARKLARTSMAKAAVGENPVKQRRIADLTVAECVQRYLGEYVCRQCKPKTVSETRRILMRDITPLWGAHPITEIAKYDINELLDRKANRRERPRRGHEDHGAGVQSNRVLALLRTFFRWCLDVELIVADPTAGIRRRTREQARDRSARRSRVNPFLGRVRKPWLAVWPAVRIAATHCPAPRRSGPIGLVGTRPREPALGDSPA
jgi:hypothetical protein